MSAEQLARFFHEAYERLAPGFGYATRSDTRAFFPESANGRLMIAVAGEVLAAMRTSPAPGAPGQEAAVVQAVVPTEEEIDRAWEASEAKPGSLHAWRLAVAWTLSRAALPAGAGEKTS